MSSVGRGCGAHAALLLVFLSLGAIRAVVGRPLVLVRRTRGTADRVVVAGWQVVRVSVGRCCGAHAVLLLVYLSLGGKSSGRRSATCAGAARSRRC